MTKPSKDYFLDERWPNHVVVTTDESLPDESRTREFWTEHNRRLFYPVGNFLWNPISRCGARELVGRRCRHGLALDLGCGNNRVDRHLTGEFGVKGVVGVDFAPGCKADVVGEAIALPFQSGTFSLVWCYGLLPYVPDVAGLVQEAWRVLAHDGVLVLYTEYASSERLVVAYRNKQRDRGIGDRRIEHLAPIASFVVSIAEAFGFRCLGIHVDRNGVWEEGEISGVPWRSPVNTVMAFEKE